MKSVVKIVIVFVSLMLLAYLSLPNPDFPLPPPDSLQSKELGDTETPLRRAYFTNFTRKEVMNQYQEQFKKSSFLNIPLLVYRLNYPPEEARSLIRDQTRSTFLEEIVQPLRVSLFVNGFEPKEEKDTIFIEDRIWRQKITVRYVPSNVWVRLGIGILTLFLLAVLLKEWAFSICQLKKGRKDG